jgi:hypothetical protein
MDAVQAADRGDAHASGAAREHARLDVSVYSPLCLALGSGTALIAERTSAAHK